MIKLPINGKWAVATNSDKYGSVSATKNLNFDEEGYVKLSPRTIAVASEADNEEFATPVAIGAYGTSSYHVATTEENFTLTFDGTSRAVTENDGTAAPNLDPESHGTFWQNTWVITTADTIESRPITGGANATWTPHISGLGDYRHILCVFENRQTLCATNGNVVKQYTTAYGASTDLTIPSDFVAVGLAYNANRMGIITRLGTSSAGQGREAYFFVWDGATTAANSGVGVGAPSCIGIVAYKSSFVVLTQAGQLLYWNGGGLEELASFPFYFTDKIWGDLLNQVGEGDIMTVDGDVIHLNLPFQLEVFGRRDQRAIPNCPSGVWSYDPKIGLYHRASGSASLASLLTVSGVNTGTDVITVSSGTIPATGNPARYSAASTAIGGLTLNQDYFVIKESSTTFKLATSKTNALLGTAIDLTSGGASSFFWAYNLVDYGFSYTAEAGAISVTRGSDILTGELLFGGSYPDTSLADKDALFATVPYLENRGYLVIPKIYPESPEEMLQEVLIKHRPLGDSDSILVKIKNKDVIGLPVSSTGTSGATWTDMNRMYVAEDLSEAKEYLDAGGSLEMEILSGAGGGTLVQVTSIEGGDSLYDIVLDEDVIGASNGLKCHFMLDNWELVPGGTVTADSHEDGYAEVPLGLAEAKTGKWHQIKLELRGSETCIEEVLISSALHKT